MYKTILLLLSFSFISFNVKAQNKILAPTPPMGFMTWNYFFDKITEEDVKTTADAMAQSGLRDLGYNFIFIDDGWQGGRDNRNNIIPDPKKFPSGMKAVADYVHEKGMRLGIYSDAAPLTCGGYTASLGFEEQDAKTFAEWGIDYLKYDFCGAPPDWHTAIARYEKMSDALKKSGRNIIFSICEWGDRQPWLWGKKAGGQLWRTTADIRDKWQSSIAPAVPSDLHRTGAGIIDVVDINGGLSQYAGSGSWNDPDMLVVGLYGKKGAPSSDLGGSGCTDVEYQSQMSLWCLMASPLMISCDVRNMNDVTKKILMNRGVIAINQDQLGRQAERKIKKDGWQVFVKPLENGDIALGILNYSGKTQQATINLNELGIIGMKNMTDLWTKTTTKAKNIMKVSVASHETKLYRLVQ